MLEDNKFKVVGTIQLYGDDIGKVSLYDASYANESEEQRIWTVTTIASLAYGNESAKSPEALYERMQSIKHDSLWEFIRDGTCGYTIEESMRVAKFKWYTLGLSHKENIACFKIKVPIFVARQFMRHRSFSYLEMSRRYTKDSKQPFEFWFPKEMEYELQTQFKHDWVSMYGALYVNGMHTQVASRFLPQTTYTEFYMMGEVEGLKNFFKLRIDKHAQEEIREVAEGMLKLLELHQPTLYTKMK